MRAAITRQHIAFVFAVAVLTTTLNCYRGDSLVDPGNAVGFRAPTADVASMTLAPLALSGTAGAQMQVFAEPLNAEGQRISPTVVAWVSSDPKVASVSGTGDVTFLHRGSATITAIADGVTAAVGADVSAPPAASLSITPDTTLIDVGQQVQLVVTAYDSSGAVDSGVVVNWSSSESGVASVSSSGLVTAIAVGAAMITVSVNSVTASATINVTSSPLVVSSVSVSPASSSLYTGRTEQLAVTLQDANGDVLSGIPVSWTTSSSGVASVSSSGVVAGNAVGSATITATASGISGTASVNVTAPVVASVSVTPSALTLSPGETTELTATASDPTGVPVSVPISWTSSNSGVASVSSSGSVTANANGSATITAAADGVSGTASVTVEAGPPGGFNEPAGMVTQVNTGPLTSAAPFSVFSPTTPNAQGEWSGNLTTVPGGSGLRLMYQPNLQGGYSPVRFGVGIPSAGTGWYYQRMKVRFSPNWTMSGNIGVKLCEPRTQQLGGPSGENHVIGTQDFLTESTHAWLYVLLQGPDGQSRDLFEQPHYVAAANLAGGAWHTIELLFTPESTPGAGNGTYTGWVDGTQIAHYTNVQWLAAGNQIGWPYLMFDPTYGGGTHSPATTMYWDFDQLYVSTK
jgi:uncharacterized protein YjdB